MDLKTRQAGSERNSQAESIYSDGLNPATTAFFFDFDGTLAEIVPEPHLAAVKPATLGTLARLNSLAGGAVAVVSGRSIAQLDELLRPLQLPVAGVHGLERRDSGGEVHCAPIDAHRHRRIANLTETFVATRPGLIAETKPGSVALHYRQRPDLQSECLALAESLSESIGPIQLLRGKMVVEMALAFRNKGDAIAEFMREAPFSGRRPWFAGDDVTDETGFAVVNAMGGISVKVGQGATAAHYRVADPASVAMHLRALCSV